MVVLLSAWGSLYRFIAKTEEILREWKKEVASDRLVCKDFLQIINLLGLFLLSPDFNFYCVKARSVTNVHPGDWRLVSKVIHE